MSLLFATAGAAATGFSQARSVLRQISGGRPTIGGVQLDITRQEIVNYIATVTNNPVEDGADITDHVRREPIRIELEGVVSNTPTFGVAGSFAEAAFEALVEVFEARRPISVSLALGDFDNLIIEQMSRTRSAQVGDSLSVSISLREINIVTTQTATVPASARASAVANSAAAEIDGGQVQGVIEDPPEGTLNNILAGFGL